MASRGHTGSGTEDGTQALVTLASKAKFFGLVFTVKGHEEEEVIRCVCVCVKTLSLIIVQ